MRVFYFTHKRNLYDYALASLAHFWSYGASVSATTHSVLASHMRQAHVAKHMAVDVEEDGVITGWQLVSQVGPCLEEET